MSENKVKWHPIKKNDDGEYSNLPQKQGEYLVTVEGITGTITDEFEENYETWETFGKNVVAWAEFPEPYKCETPNQNKVKWHPYPSELPKREDLFFVTFMTKFGDKGVDIDKFTFDEKWWGSPTDEQDMDWVPEWVIAWAEFPEPYKPGSKNEQ